MCYIFAKVDISICRSTRAFSNGNISRASSWFGAREMKVKREFKTRYSDLVISERNDVSVAAEMGKYVLVHFVYRHLYTILVLQVFRI